MTRKYVQHWASASGAQYTYFRYRDQKRIALTNPDDPQFDAAYDAALRRAKKLELKGLTEAPLRKKPRQRDIADAVKALTVAGKTVTGIVIDAARGITTITLSDHEIQAEIERNEQAATDEARWVAHEKEEKERRRKWRAARNFGTTPLGKKRLYFNSRSPGGSMGPRQ